MNVSPVLPVAVATILPLVAADDVGLVTVPLTVMTTPAQGLANTKEAEPVQPLPFFAIIVYEPGARLVKLPDDWNAPPLILKVKPEPPEADALMLPSVAVGPVGLLVVPDTLTVTPEHGLGGVVLPPSLLLQE